MVVIGPAWVRLLAAAMVALVLLGDARVAKEYVRLWANGESTDNAIVDTVVALNPASCPVYQAEFDEERQLALPNLVALRGSTAPCRPRLDAVLVQPVGIPSISRPISEVCASRGGWEPIGTESVPTVYGCRRLRPEDARWRRSPEVTRGSVRQRPNPRWR